MTPPAMILFRAAEYLAARIGDWRRDRRLARIMRRIEACNRDHHASLGSRRP